MKCLVRYSCAALLAISCHSTVGTFTPAGYKHPDLDYDVRYVDAEKKTLMPEAWQLDNFYLDKDKLTAKKGADYELTRYLDTDDDGKREDIGKTPTYDLRFVHKKNGGVVWVRTAPLEVKLKDRELRVLAGDFIDGIAGGGYTLVQLEGQLYTTNNSRHYATKILSQGSAKLAKHEAYAATVDVSNVDQLKVDPASVEVRLMLVISRTDFEFTTYMTEDRKFPILMMCEYSNTPADFDAGLPDFLGLLSRIQFGGASGFEQPQPEAPATPKPPAPEIQNGDGGVTIADAAAGAPS